MIKLYRFYNNTNKHLITKFYTLSGIKSLLNNKRSYLNNSHKLADREVIEYELKEVRRLELDEVKQLSNKINTIKYLELLELVTTKSGLTIEFYDCNTGSVWTDHGSNSIEFNSLDEAIEIVSKY